MRRKLQKTPCVTEQRGKELPGTSGRQHVIEHEETLWFDRIHGGSTPHNMAPNAWDFFGLCSAPNDHTFWVLGAWNRWKSPRHDVGKCHGFPRARLPFLTHNMARPPKNMLATAFRVSPKRNRRKNGWRHIIWQNPLRQYWRHLGGHQPFSATSCGGRERAAP